MTKTLPGSVGPAHQPFRRPGAGRGFGERPGSAVSFRESRHCQYPPVAAARPGQVQMGATSAATVSSLAVRGARILFVTRTGGIWACWTLRLVRPAVVPVLSGGGSGPAFPVWGSLQGDDMVANHTRLTRISGHSGSWSVTPVLERHGNSPATAPTGTAGSCPAAREAAAAEQRPGAPPGRRACSATGSGPRPGAAPRRCAGAGRLLRPRDPATSNGRARRVRRQPASGGGDCLGGGPPSPEPVRPPPTGPSAAEGTGAVPSGHAQDGTTPSGPR